jgi:hypothetical protein
MEEQKNSSHVMPDYFISAATRRGPGLVFSQEIPYISGITICKNWKAGQRYTVRDRSAGGGIPVTG